MVYIVTATRAHSQVDLGASPRGSLALLKVSRARAAIAGRDFVTPDDVKAVAMPALAHRIILKPDPWVRGGRGSAGPSGVLGQVPLPEGAREAHAPGGRPPRRGPPGLCGRPRGSKL